LTFEKKLNNNSTGGYMEVRENLKYTKTHEWVKIEGDEFLCGITDYAQKELSDIIYVEFKEPPVELKKGEPFGTIEAVKAVSEVYMPLSGEVMEVNGKVKNSPEIINQDPYDEGWMIKGKIKEKKEIEELLNDKKYKEIIEK
jgi:glycine cleavage system H protein